MGNLCTAVVGFLSSFLFAIDIYALINYLLPCIAIIYAFNFISGYLLYRTLKSSGMALPSVRRFLTLYSLFEPRYQPICFGIISLYLMYRGLHSSFSSKDYTYFARSGALITIAGINLSLVGDRFVSSFARDVIAEFHSSDFPDHREALDTKARRLKTAASFWVVFITVMGTIIWAYGDVFLQRFASDWETSSTPPELKVTFPFAPMSVPTAPAISSLLIHVPDFRVTIPDLVSPNFTSLVAGSPPYLDDTPHKNSKTQPTSPRKKKPPRAGKRRKMSINRPDMSYDFTARKLQRSSERFVLS